MEPLEILRHIVVFFHLVGFAVLFGAWTVEAVSKRRQVSRLMDWGLAIAGIAGLILAAPWGIDGELNYVKIGVKLVVLLIIGALIGVGSSRQRKGGSVPAGVFWSIGILTLFNAAIGVIWR
jgi:hypothetical protein